MRFSSVLTLLLACSSVANAQAGPEGTEAEAGSAEVDPSEHLDEAARILFQEGTRAYAAGRFDEARGRYETALELSGRPELLYNIAQCNDRLDLRAEALEYYERFVAELPDSSYAAIVNSRIEVLRRSLAESSGPDDADGSAGGEAADDQEEPAGEGAEPQPRSLVGPITAFAVGGAGLVTFAVAGILAGARYGDAEAECDTMGCNEDSLSGVQTAALVADIGLVVGVAGATVGVLWLLLSGGGDQGGESARATTLVPTVSARHAGVSLQGGF